MNGGQASDWRALCRLADEHGSADNTVTQIVGRHPESHVTDNGGAQARCVHSEEWEGVVLADGTRVTLEG